MQLAKTESSFPRSKCFTAEKGKVFHSPRTDKIRTKREFYTVSTGFSTVLHSFSAVKQKETGKIRNGSFFQMRKRATVLWGRTFSKSPPPHAPFQKILHERGEVQSVAPSTMHKRLCTNRRGDLARKARWMDVPCPRCTKRLRTNLFAPGHPHPSPYGCHPPPLGEGLPQAFVFATDGKKYLLTKNRIIP